MDLERTMNQCQPIMEPLRVDQLYEQGHTRATRLFSDVTHPWEALPHIAAWIREIGAGLDPKVYDHPSEDVWIARNATVAPTAFIGGPCIIGEHTEVRHGAFIRGSALVGDGCVVGNSVELKNVILFDGVQTPHYNYVGDSVLGYKAHMGAGSITSNVKSDKTLVTIRTQAGTLTTGCKKMGAMLGDYVEIGCNSVLNPGTLIGAHTQVYPLSSVRGVIPSHSIVKTTAAPAVVAKRST